MSSTPKRILVVEDDAGLAELFRQGLTEQGFDCQTVASASECLTQVASSLPDLLLLDYSLPDSSATALVEELLRVGRLPSFLVITGHGDERVAVQLMKQGARDYLIKDALLLDRLPLVVLRVFQEMDTERRLMEAQMELRESEEKYQALFEAISDAIFVHDINEDGAPGLILEVNDVACRMLGFSRKELLQRRAADIDVPEANLDASQVMGRIKAGEDCLFEHTHARRDGGRVPVEIHARPFRYRGRPAVLSTVRDITERKRMEEALRRSLEEKTGLLKEVHHRVKNNLQIMNSLVQLQANRMTNHAALEALRDTQARIRSMSLLHETLYRSGRMDRVEFQEYVRHLCDNLAVSHGAPDCGVTLRNDVPRTTLAISQAVPCGLIISELVSNAFKHAFPRGRQGEVLVALELDAEGRAILRVTDDGVGLPAGLDLERTDSLGLELVAGLARQIRGRLEVRRDKGACFEIHFTPAGSGQALIAT